MTVYRGNMFPEWQGDIFVTSLIYSKIIQIDMQGGRAAGQTGRFAEIGDRLRDIRTGPDGALYILSEGANGKLWRVSRN